MEPEFYTTNEVGLGFPLMLVGYMRVSIDGDREVINLQRNALLAAGVDERHLFEDLANGSRGDLAGLAKALAFLRASDCLVVWKFDGLGRSLPHLLTTVTDLKARSGVFRSLRDARPPSGAACHSGGPKATPRSEGARPLLGSGRPVN